MFNILYSYFFDDFQFLKTLFRIQNKKEREFSIVQFNTNEKIDGGGRNSFSKNYTFLFASDEKYKIAELPRRKRSSICGNKCKQIYILVDFIQKGDTHTPTMIRM